MMFLQTADGGAVALHIDDYCVKELASGLDELQFSISIYDPEYKLIQEQAQIREESEGTALYLVQAIDGGGDTATVKAVLDLTDWTETMLLNYDAGEVFPGVVVNAVKPSGWTLQDYSGILYTRPISMDGGTPLDLLDKMRDEFDGLTYRFDNIQKIVTVIDQYKGPNAGGPDAVGTYLTRELNLKSIEFKGKSTELCTRFYVVGADGLTFADINGGKAYVEDFSYTTRVICKYVNDPRFTDAANMLAWAREYVQQLAVPVRSYEVDVADLARADPDKYGFLSFPLYTKILLIDDTRPEARVFVRVAAVWRYPGRPEKNRVMLSTIAPRIQTQVKEALKPITAQRMGAGAVGKRALSAPLKDEMKNTAESAAEANTLATTANTNANQAKETANSALSAANQAKDTASSASGTADATNNSLLLLEYKIRHASSFEDLKESI